MNRFDKITLTQEQLTKIVQDVRQNTFEPQYLGNNLFYRFVGRCAIIYDTDLNMIRVYKQVLSDALRYFTGDVDV